MISELTEWLALHRAQQGEVARQQGGYVRAEQTLTGHLAAAFDALLDGGLLALDAPDDHGVQRLGLTESGQARYAALHGGRHNGQLTPGYRPPHPPGRLGGPG